MALLMVQEGVQPAGQYDLGDGYTPKGGELYVLCSVGAGTDGYQVVKARPALTTDGYGPYYLADDGLTGYGVLFGNTVTRTATGFASGQDNATRLGPTTNAGSGKVTLWAHPGLYAVTLDALGTQTEATWQALYPGAKLTVTTGGALLNGGTANMPAVSVVGYKVDESLVTTGGAVVARRKLVIRFNPYGSV